MGVRNTSDVIERYLQRLLRDAADGVVELQRGGLAERFSCVPSQINYVIATRFTPLRGYVVESKRGGGGYIRIRVLRSPHVNRMDELFALIGDAISQTEAEGIISRLERENLLEGREGALLRAAVSRETLDLPLPERDRVRARVLKGVLTALFAHSSEGR